MKIDELKKIIFSNRFDGGLIFFFLFFVGLVLIFWPALFGGKVINDFFGFDLAQYKFLTDFGQSLKQGFVQLWWSDYLSGFPVYLTQTGLFNPLVFIFYKFFSGFAVYNWLTLFNFLLGGLAMYWLSRNLALSKIASAVVGLTYMLSQNYLYWGPTLIFSNVYPFIPLFFLVLLKISQGSSWTWWLSGILIAVYGLAAAETQIVFYIFVIGFFWALFLKYEIKNWKPVLGYFSVSAIGALLASFWILPVLNYLKFTTRGVALSFSDLAYDFMRMADPLRFFYPYIQLPQFTGWESLGIVPNYYIGVLTFLLAITAIFLVRKNKIVAFWLGVAVFSLLVRIKWTGIFWVLHFLPGFDRFRGVFHWAFIGSFALALLAGFGLDSLEKIKESRYFNKFVGALKIFAWMNVVFVAAIFSVSFFRDKILNWIFQFFDVTVYKNTRQFPLEHYHGVIASEFNKFLNAFSFSDYHFLVSFLSVLTATLILILFIKNKISFENFKKTALVFVFFNLVLIWQGYYVFIPQSKITDYPDTVKFIKNQSDNTSVQRCIEADCGFRFFRFYPPESYQTFEVFNVKDWTDYKLKTMESNIGVYFGMDTFGGVEPFLSARIANIFDEIGFERPSTISAEPWLRSTKLSLDQKISRFSSPQNQNLISMLNIKYIFSSFKLPNFNLIYETTATEKNIPVYVYENPKVMPRIYFASGIKFTDAQSAWNELLNIKNFSNVTLIECQENCPDSGIAHKSDSITIEGFRPQEVKIKATNTSGRWLIYSDANLPTWGAYINNQKTPIYTANYLFKSVFVPKGEHEIVFKYPNLWGQFKYAFENFILGRQ